MSEDVQHKTALHYTVKSRLVPNVHVLNIAKIKFLNSTPCRHGAAVNAEDVQHKTALHYAVQEHRLDTTKVMLKSS